MDMLQIVFLLLGGAPPDFWRASSAWVAVSSLCPSCSTFSKASRHVSCLHAPCLRHQPAYHHVRVVVLRASVCAEWPCGVEGGDSRSVPEVLWEGWEGQCSPVLWTAVYCARSSRRCCCSSPCGSFPTKKPKTKNAPAVHTRVTVHGRTCRTGVVAGGSRRGRAFHSHHAPEIPA